MSRITTGEIELALGDDTVILRPTLNAATRISARYGGFMQAIQAVGQMSVDALVFVVKEGTGANNREEKDLPKKIYAAGLSNVAPDVIRYLRCLMNGGRDPDEADEDGSGEGNG